MKNRIITISRECGSGGRTVGRLLAERLNIPCYDQEIIERIAEKTGLAKEYVRETTEYMEHSGWLAGAFIPCDRSGHSMQGDLWSLQKRIIADLARKGPCVIVGRCADFILKDDADLLRVFIHADIDKRVQRVTEVYGEAEESNPRKFIISKDKRREAYYNYYTHQKWGSSDNYDISLNSGTLGIEGCVDILEKMY